ncbi:sensor histidine kinase [Labedella populi]|uniref:histidine kinase n=1 Tax=Labedella populi TaxID=2498850 RepID=A0A3S4ED89_9MICO|nr:sensor histidine kinase [Labedella populi]RWZ68678.1 sensor histidine kinase [Labedella populi]
MTWPDGQGSSRFDDAPPWRRASARARLWFPVVFSLVVQGVGTAVVVRLLGLPAPAAAVAMTVAVVGPLALLGARRHPGPVAAVVALATAVDLLIAPEPGPPPVSLAFAVVFGIVRGARTWVVASIASAWVGVLVLAPALGHEWPPGRIVLSTVALLVLVLVGVSVRERRERAVEFRRLAAQRRQSAEQAERVRIARELHDVLAHSLSQISVQAGVGLHLMDVKPEEARAALASIKSTSKDALDEVRSVLGVLRGDDDVPTSPARGLADVDSLVDGVRRSGIEVSVDVAPDITETVSTTVGAAVYRIVQEALTNVVRHSGAARVEVRARIEGGAVVVSVADDGRGPDGATEGNGILGMRERAALSGGGLTAGAAPSGGFLVSASLPLGATA